MAKQLTPSLIARVEGLPIILVFVMLLALFMYLAPQVFLQPFIYTTFLSTLPPLILLATGLTFIIGAGEIDLSFPRSSPFPASSLPFSSRNTTSAGWPWLAGLASGVLVGFVNGILVAKIGIPSFMATLATQFFWAGMATVLSGGKSYALRGAEESSVWKLIVGRPFADAGSRLDRADSLSVAVDPGHRGLPLVHPEPAPLRRARPVHRRFEQRVARPRHRCRPREDQALHADGRAGRLAAIMLTLENKNYFGNQGQGYLLTAIASVLIGGTSIFGGRATIVGTVFGCFIIGMIEPGLVAAGLTGAWVRTVQGLVFLTAIIFYLYVDEPQRRAAFFARMRLRRREIGRPASAG